MCLTPENLTAPWILFETGALSKTIESTYVCPYLLELKPTDIQGPLAQFQAAKADPTDTLDLVKSINAAQGETALPAKSIEAGFNKWWPELDKELREISKQSASLSDRKKRTEMDVLEEILDIVRQLSRKTSQAGSQGWTATVGGSTASMHGEVTPEVEAMAKELMDVAREQFRQVLLKQAAVARGILKQPESKKGKKE